MKLIFACILTGLLSFLASAFATASPTLTDLIQTAHAAQLATKPAWLNLLHDRPKVFGWGSESQADDAQFFLSAQGKTNPLAELNASIQAFLEGDGQATHPQCRFPARFHWLREQDPRFQQIPEVPCPELQQWLKDLHTEAVTLVFASSYLNSPSSMFGHTFLRLDPPDLNQNNPILASTISYAADARAHDNELMFAYRGIFGGYPGITSVEPYFDKVRLYSQLENRDLWEYRLNLSPDEVTQLLRHAWEIKDKRFDYFFFDENCAYRILALIDVARPGTELISQVNSLRAIPSDTVRLVVANDLVQTVHYRPSQSSRLRQDIRLLDATERQLAATIFDTRQLHPEALAKLPAQRQAAVLETAYELTRYRTLDDKLPREETAELSYQLLQARSRIAEPSPLTPPPVPAVRDDQGHPTGRTGLQYGQEGDHHFVEFDIRPAYHDLTDPAPGYRPGSHLQFLNTQLRYDLEDDRLKLQQLNLVEILSLSPRNRFFHPTSWRAGFGANRHLTQDGRRPLAAYVEGGAGASAELATGLAYAMATADFRVSDQLDKGFQLAPGVLAGWSLQRDSYALQFGWHSRFYPEQPDEPYHRLWLEVDWHWGENWGINLQAARENSGDVFDTSVQAGFRYYF